MVLETLYLLIYIEGTSSFLPPASTSFVIGYTFYWQQTTLMEVALFRTMFPLLHSTNWVTLHVLEAIPIQCVVLTVTSPSHLELRCFVPTNSTT